VSAEGTAAGERPGGRRGVAIIACRAALIHAPATLAPFRGLGLLAILARLFGLLDDPGGSSPAGAFVRTLCRQPL